MLGYMFIKGLKIVLWIVEIYWWNSIWVIQQYRNIVLVSLFLKVYVYEKGSIEFGEGFCGQ